MLKDKEKVIKVLIGIIILGTILFSILLWREKSKTSAFLGENFSKGFDNVQVLVKIKQETPEGQYNDSLYYPIDKWSTINKDEVKKDIQARVDNWLNALKSPTPSAEVPQEPAPAE